MKLLLSFCLIITISFSSLAQEQVEVLSTSQFKSHERLFLAPLESWIFKNGKVQDGERPDIDISDWQKFNPIQLTKDLEDPDGRVEGWFRIKIKLDESFEGVPLAISRELWAATDVYIDGELYHSFGDTGDPYTAFNPFLKYPVPVSLEVGKEYLIALHFVDYESTFTQRELRLKPQNLQGFINLTGPAFNDRITSGIQDAHIYGALSIAVSFLLFFLFWLLVFLNPEQKVFKLIALLTSFTLLGGIASFSRNFYELSYDQEKVRFLIENFLQPISTVFGLLILEWILTRKISMTLKVIFALLLITNFFAHLFAISLPFGIVFMAMLVYLINLLYQHRTEIKGAQLAIVASLVVPTITAFVWITIHKYSLDLFYEYDQPLTSLLTLGAPVFLLIYISVRFKELLNEVSTEAEKVIKVTEEKKELLSQQNIVLEQKVSERTNELHKSLEDLKATQSQLIHSEKMASLGELTAGIAHEIQNPLNFVNNFSEINTELIQEIRDEKQKTKEERDEELENDLLNDIGENQDKINHHGKRASDIVKSMLEHSRQGDGKKEPTDINKLADEYLRLAYHGIRAKDKEFNADFELNLDKSLPKVKVVPQDIGRVLLNLINNAFFAVREVENPIVTVTTKAFPLEEGAVPAAGMEYKGVEICVTDNGPGIPEQVQDKIFQPFFTTKATGEGTGLGLSLSYDIVKSHGGEIKLESTQQKGTSFIVVLPIG